MFKLRWPYKARKPVRNEFDRYALKAAVQAFEKNQIKLLARKLCELDGEQYGGWHFQWGDMSQYRRETYERKAAAIFKFLQR